MTDITETALISAGVTGALTIALRLFDAWNGRRTAEAEVDVSESTAQLNREKADTERYNRLAAATDTLQKRLDIQQTRLDAQAALIETQQGQIVLLRQENAELRRTNERLMATIRAYQTYQGEVEALDSEVSAHGIALPKVHLPEVV